jgi:hypothetical protein
MKEIPVSEFKAKCLSVLAEVQKTKTPVLVTRFGQPLDEVSPPSANVDSASWIGSMKDSMKIVGDIISPASDKNEWEALRD